MGEHAIHVLTWKEADAFLGEAMGTGTTAFLYQLSELVDMFEHVHIGEASSGRLGEMFTALRRPELRALFAGSDNTALAGAGCRLCGGSLRRGGRGRPAVYCRPACRQAAYRRRKGQMQRQYELPASMVHVLMELELQQLRRYAHRLAEKDPADSAATHQTKPDSPASPLPFGNDG
ncbi:hypothetical protein [Nocardia sp. NPDC004860]|uniref:hypothetical protein n=1 Tax=Nocardia sp. NPDC004860 TaxID=3154557 RepID=UPI0033BD2840